MSWLPAFTAWNFALAGALAAAGSVVIHLLNRRRYRVVQWAAMDFLREAIQRNRRLLHLRDWLLMALRCLAVLLFGLALARPYFSSPAGSADDRQALHAIVVLDNSLSMGHEVLGQTLLARAREKARGYLEKLPAGSRATIIPACGSLLPWSLEPHANNASAVAALEQVAVVARPFSVLAAVNEARRAAALGPPLARRIVVFTDQQQENWQGLDSPAQLQDLPPVQFVQLAPTEDTNTSIAEVRLEDGIADTDTPARFVATLRHAGSQPRSDIPVRLWVDGEEVATQTVSFESGTATREVTFEHLFDSPLPEAGRPQFVPIKVTLAPDHLPLDDERHLVVPLVAALPVVFIDQLGSREDPARNLWGETRSLRKLLAPRLSRNDMTPGLIRPRHITPDEVTRDLLADARCVVVAGVTSPTEDFVALLREYVQQGGRLLIAAGAEFDPVRWQAVAWQNGAGILPAPLLAEPWGAVPQGAAELKWWNLAFDTLRGDPLFHLAGVPEQEQLDLYSEPLFFKLVQVDVTSEALAPLAAAVREESQRLLSAASTQSASGKAPLPSAATGLNESVPAPPLDWLVWGAGAEFPVESSPPADVSGHERWQAARVARSLPRVAGHVQGPAGPPLFVSRSIGQGEVVFCSTGLVSPWNTLSSSHAMLVFDRLVRGMLAATLPQRNHEPREQLALPIGPATDLSLSLWRPDAPLGEPLDIGFLGEAERGVVLPHLWQAGLYRVVAERRAAVTAATGTAATEPAWTVPLAINAPAAESDPTLLTQRRFAEITAGSSWRWLTEDDEISLAGATIQGQNLWWYLVAAVLLLLLGEMLVLAWPLAAVAPRSMSSGSPARPLSV